MKKNRLEFLNYGLAFLVVSISVVLFLLFCFEYDLQQTASSSYAILSGHILDFYDYNIKTKGLETVYGIFIYIIFAIWNIPLKILGINPVNGKLPIFALYWNKMLLIFFLLACAVCLYQIALKINIEKESARSIMVAFLAMPLMFFIVVLQGSYDILYVLFLLIGFWLWIGENNTKTNVLASLFFGLSICIKPFAAFYYLILLLLKEKNIFYIIKNGIITILPYLLFNVLYMKSESYQTVLAFNKRNLGNFFANSFTYLCPFIFCFIFICAYSYWKEDGEITDAICLCNFMTFAFIGFSMYHPQWILSAIPFWVLAAFYNKKHDGYMLCMLLVTVAYYILFALEPEVNVNQNMFYLLTNRGIGNLDASVFSIDKFYKIKDIRIPYSIVSVGTFLLAFFSQKKFSKDLKVVKVDYKKWDYNKGILLFVFGVGVLAYVIPALLCWYPPKFMERIVVGKDLENNIPSTTTNWVDLDGYDQFFYLKDSIYATKLELSVYTWDKKYNDDDKITITLLNQENDIVCNKDIALKEISSPIVSVDVNENLQGNQWYTVEIKGNSEAEADQAALGVYTDYNKEQMYLCKNGIECNQTLAMNINGKYKK
jgi:hypothetical protein